MDVTTISSQFKTDKHLGRFPHSKLYDSVLKPYKDLPIRLLEIGVNRGGSIKLWEEYFPNASIYTIDINPLCKHYETDRTHVDIVDQSKKNELLDYMAKVGGQFDIIIDDGSHMTSHQILTFNTLWPFVVEGGMFIMEDTDTSNDPSFIDSTITCFEYFQHLTRVISSGCRNRPPWLIDLNYILFKYNLILVTKA